MNQDTTSEVVAFTISNLKGTSLFDLMEIDKDMVLSMVKEQLNLYKVRKVKWWWTQISFCMVESSQIIVCLHCFYGSIDSKDCWVIYWDKNKIKISFVDISTKVQCSQIGIKNLEMFLSKSIKTN